MKVYQWTGLWTFFFSTWSQLTLKPVWSLASFVNSVVFCICDIKIAGRHPEPNVTEILVKISSFSSLLIEDTMILIKTDVHNWFWSQLKCFWKAYLNDKQDEAKINNEFHECSSCHHFRGRYKILAYYFVWNI